MGYRRGLGDEPNVDTATYHRLHDAAVALANARKYGTAATQAAAAAQLTQAKASADAHTLAQFNADSAPGLFDSLLGGLQSVLTAPAKAAAIGLGIIGLLTLGPPLLQLASSRRRRGH